MSRRRFLKRASGLLVPIALTPTLAFPGIITLSGGRTISPGGGGGGEFTFEGLNGGVIAEGETIEVSALGGENFGTGPTKALWAQLNSGTNGAAGQSSDTQAGGDFDDLDNGSYYSTAFARSGQSAAVLYDGAQDVTPYKLYKNFTASRSAKVRFWMYVPTDKALPDCTVGSYNSASSAFKVSWLSAVLNGGAVGGTPDICLPSFNGGTGLILGGNGGPNSNGNNNWDPPWNVSSSFRYGFWCMYETCVFVDVSDHVILRARVCNAFHGSQEGTGSPEEGFDGWLGTSPEEWAWCNLPGYVRNDGYPDCILRFCDYSILTGDDCDNECFFGNASTFSACDDFRHLEPVSQTSSLKSAIVRSVDTVDLENWYFYNRLSDGSLLTPRLVTRV